MKANTLTPIMTFMTRFYRNSIFSSRLFSQNILKLLPLLFTGGMLFSINACEEDPSKIGANLLPGTDFVNIKSTDTITVNSYTMFNDSVKSDNPAFSYIGNLYDPYFGSTTAGFVSQLHMYPDSMTDLDFFVVDSVKLYLSLLTVKGDSTAEHFIKFSEISQQIYDTLPYYSNQIVPLTGESWSVALPTLRPDTINDIVVTVPKAFGEYMTRTKSMLFMSNNRPDFRSYFKGLYFEIISTGNPIFTSLTLQSSGTRGLFYNNFTVYIHDANANPLSYDFVMDSYSKNAAYNIYKHDFSTAAADKRIKHINDRYPDSLSYVQNMNGVYTRLEIPSLKALKSDPALKNIAVNRARLVIPFVAEAGAIYAKTIPSIVYLRYLTSKGVKYIVRDADPTYGPGATFYDGKPDTTTAFAYNINIATYLQDYLEDTKDSVTTNLELFLDPTSPYNAVLRANKSSKPVKLEFTYTKF
jgi:hypothetical protein